MREVAERAGRIVLRHEMLFVFLAVAILFGSIPVAERGLELSWDALNHHIYLGWVADHLRFDRDFMAASSQSVQFPYLYWPAYKLAAANLHGVTAGLVLATLQATIALPAWLLARACMPGGTLFDAFMRFASVLLALQTSAILLLVNTTNNDIASAIPLVWALALAVLPFDRARPAWLTVHRCILLSGLAAGAAVACKWSNGPLAVLLPGLWMLQGASLRERVGHVVRGGMMTLVGFALGYGYWAWVLWQQFGNPMYPMFDNYFAPLRALTGWAP